MSANKVREFLDVYGQSLNKHGEELCGDKFKILRTGETTRVVLSDGLGSGVKANILATLTSEIIATMLKEDAPLTDVIETITGTLPTCHVRKIAYATFTIIEFHHEDNTFGVINFDNPPIFYLKHGQVTPLEEHQETIHGKALTFSKGTLERGDFLGAISDGVWYAGLGYKYNFGWGWDNIAEHMAALLKEKVRAAQTVVEEVMQRTNELYGSEPGDDATMIGLLLRRRNRALVFTGPPLHKEDDERCARRLLRFDGRRIVCGGTTGKIVARSLKTEIMTVIPSIREDVPPIGRLPGVHLLTEGILTMTKALEYMQAAEGDLSKLPDDNNGAVLLALELLSVDEITFVAGLSINPFYQNPLLPQSISIRRNTVEAMAQYLRALNKEVHITYC